MNWIKTGSSQYGLNVTGDLLGNCRVSKAAVVYTVSVDTMLVLPDYQVCLSRRRTGGPGDPS